MKVSLLKTLFVAMFLAAFSSPLVAQRQAATEQPKPQASALHPVTEIRPGDAVMFVSHEKGSVGYVIWRTPEGGLALLPANETTAAAVAGYRIVTASEFLDAIGLTVKSLQETTKRLDALTSDYNILAERFNRLAALNSTTAVPTQPAPAVDERQAMRLMLFQSLLSRTVPPPPVKVQVTDCTKYPALCTHQ
jgi:hypothetical protein